MKQGKAIITIKSKEEDDGCDVNITIEFDPPIVKEGDKEYMEEYVPCSHLVALELIKHSKKIEHIK